MIILCGNTTVSHIREHKCVCHKFTRSMYAWMLSLVLPPFKQFISITIANLANRHRVCVIYQFLYNRVQHGSSNQNQSCFTKKTQHTSGQIRSDLIFIKSRINLAIDSICYEYFIPSLAQSVHVQLYIEKQLEWCHAACLITLMPAISLIRPSLW